MSILDYIKKNKTDAPGIIITDDGKVIYPETITAGSGKSEFGILIFMGITDGEPVFLSTSITHETVEFGRIPIFPEQEPTKKTEPEPLKTMDTQAGDPEPPEPDTKSKSTLNPGLATYPPSFLTENSVSDLGTFHSFLTSSSHTPRTIEEYEIDLRIWQRELDGNLTPDSIMQVLELFKTKPHRKTRLLSVLSKYGKYRCLYGDNRIAFILAASQQIKHPKISHENKGKDNGLTPESVKIFRQTANSLCNKNDPTGIWMALSLWGFRPSEFQNIIIKKTTLEVERKRGKYSVKVPPWLIASLNKINGDSWRHVSRTTIRRRLKSYETSIKNLYCAAVTYADNNSSNGRRNTKKGPATNPEKSKSGDLLAAN